MMYLDEADVGFDPAFPDVLVPLRPNCAVERIAWLTAKRPNSRKDQANWVVWNGVSYDNGNLQLGWEDNNKFFKYVKGARNATWKGDAAAREFTIEEEGRSGWWKQYNYNNKANTIIPTHLRLRYADADQGA
jgi:hypothetical protein